MKSLNKARTSFTTAGAQLRVGRKEDIRGSYAWLLGVEVSGSFRNTRLLTLCSELVTHGHYAKPKGFDASIPSTYRSLRHGVMCHMFKVWFAIPGRGDSRWEGESGFSFRLRQWGRFCAEFNYDAESTLFL
jgi:hypothetical protein